MTAEEIMATAKEQGDLPHGWVVLPLQRQKVIVEMLWWAVGILFGFGAFAFVSFYSIPYNYTHGIGLALFATLLLGITLFIALGSIYMLIADIQRLREVSEHVIVLTPDELVKQEGKRKALLQIPLLDVQNVTARGTPPPNRKTSDEPAIREVPGSGENMLGFLVGRGAIGRGYQYRRSRMRTPTSLAFIDTRSGKEVKLLGDGSYGDPFAIAEILRQYIDSAQRRIRR
jgi:hypothetical protein